MIAVLLVLAALNIAGTFLCLSAVGRVLLERAADRDADIDAHNAVVRQVNKLGEKVGWCAEEVQTLCTSWEMQR